MVMQREIKYTGLKDKNGKKIYKGNIVRWGNNPSPIDVYEVLWIPLEWVLQPIYNRYIFHTLTYPESYEIIGDNNENPELLKEVK